jgi:hypothetical protein
VSRTGPLTIDDFMEVIGVRNISRLQKTIPPASGYRLLFLFGYSRF